MLPGASPPDEDRPDAPASRPAPQRKLGRIVAAVLGVGLAAATLWYRASGDPLPAATDPPATSTSTAPAVTGGLVAQGPYVLRVEGEGRLAPWRRSVVSPRAAGVVVRLNVTVGSFVRQGDPLFSVDDQTPRLDLAEAEAALAKASVEYEVAQRSGAFGAELDSLRDATLRDLGVTPPGEPPPDRSGAEAALAARTGVAEARQRVARARAELALVTAYAPFTGRVSALEVEVGQYVAPGTEALTLVEDTRLVAEVELLEADVVQVRPGAAAQVTVPVSLPQLDLAARVRSVDPVVDPETGRGRAFVEVLTRDRDLKPGLFAQATLDVSTIPARALVPRDAVLERDGRAFVFRIRDGHVQWLFVDEVARDASVVAISGGVAPGDTVAVSGHASLIDGTRVQLDSLRSPTGP